MNPFSLNIKGQLYTWHTPIVMGIINATPDSFYTQSQYNSLQERIDTIGSMVTDGATIIDLGAASTQPGASIINSNEEVDRLMPVLEKAVSLFPNILFSIDTYHATVARQAVEAGAHIINDISAGAIDEDMLATVADLNVPYIIMHMQGTYHATKP
jgi:dihydropteroate synthase